MKCKDCVFWQDFSDRVYAKISDTRNINLVRGIVELRKCRNVPPPTVDMNFNIVYTDSEHGCSAFTRMKQV